MTSLSRIRRASAALAFCTALLAPALAGATGLTLINGWKNYGSGTAKASVSLLHGIARFKGAIKTTGSDGHPFVLPAGFRPAADVYVPVDMCGASNGRLHIYPTGEVLVQAESDFSNAQCFTSLDGVSYAVSTDGFKPLKLRNGWEEYNDDAVDASGRNIGGIVHLASSIDTAGGSDIPFILPGALRPATQVYVKVDVCGGKSGRLRILPDGTAHVETANFIDAQCFTSLDGASYALNSGGFTLLGLIGGWSNYGNGLADAAVKVSGKVVQLQGAIRATGSSDSHPFVLPAGARPAKIVYVPVDMCNATNGRLIVTPQGAVTIEAESSFANAQCFTSLDGVSFLK